MKKGYTLYFCEAHTSPQDSTSYVLQDIIQYTQQRNGEGQTKTKTKKQKENQIQAITQQRQLAVIRT